MGTRYYHYDGLGSTQLLTDENGNVTDSHCNTAYGTSVSTAANPTTNPFQYVGQLGSYLNPDTGDYYVRARTYSPLLARWLSEDPIVVAEMQYREVRNEATFVTRRWPANQPVLLRSLTGAAIGFEGTDANLYRYAWNGPTNGSDATGLGVLRGTRIVVVGRARHQVNVTISGSCIGPANRGNWLIQFSNAIVSAHMSDLPGIEATQPNYTPFKSGSITVWMTYYDN